MATIKAFPYVLEQCKPIKLKTHQNGKSLYIHAPVRQKPLKSYSFRLFVTSYGRK